MPHDQTDPNGTQIPEATAPKGHAWPNAEDFGELAAFAEDIHGMGPNDTHRSTPQPPSVERENSTTGNLSVILRDMEKLREENHQLRTERLRSFTAACSLREMEGRQRAIIAALKNDVAALARKLDEKNERLADMTAAAFALSDTLTDLANSIGIVPRPAGAPGVFAEESEESTRHGTDSVFG